MYRLVAIILLSLLLFNCAAAPKYRGGSGPGYGGTANKPLVSGTKDVPKELVDAPSLKTLRGKASWYGPKYHGRKTANGETYNMYGNSAAHKELPFNTWVRVVNLKTNNAILTRINDRGPFIEGRIIDLSYGAAKDLGILIDGVVDVKVEVVKWGPTKK